MGLSHKVPSQNGLHHFPYDQNLFQIPTSTAKRPFHGDTLAKGNLQHLTEDGLQRWERVSCSKIYRSKPLGPLQGVYIFTCILYIDTIHLYHIQACGLPSGIGFSKGVMICCGAYSTALKIMDPPFYHWRATIWLTKCNMSNTHRHIPWNHLKCPVLGGSSQLVSG